MLDQYQGADIFQDSTQENKGLNRLVDGNTSRQVAVQPFATLALEKKSEEVRID